VAEPVSIMINTFGTGIMPSNEIARLVREEFDMRPAAIIETLDLLRPIYRKTAAYGHFGRELAEFSWERTDRVESLRNRAGL
jgi:S-adenosylmethionine synthetase